MLAAGLLATSAIEATAQDETTGPTAPVEFSGKISFGPCSGAETVEGVPGKVVYRGEHYCNPGVVEPFSDPRLEGTYYVWPYHDAHLGGPEIWASAFTITNDEGAWRGIPAISISDTGTEILVGEGAYDGLTAIAEVTLNGTIWDWHGWIIEGDLPPLPEEPAAIP
jgi:hypothetical protein